MQNNDSFSMLKNDFPAILADLTTFKENPNCSCKGRVIKFFSDQLLLDPNILDKYISDPIKFGIMIENMENQRQLQNYSGRIFTIQKGEEAWKSFAQNIQGKMFRGFSVIERENDIVVYLL